LAWAIARHLAEKNASLTLFATHYFELTRLAEEFHEVANVHLDAVEHKDHIVFLHSVEEGPANQSYGLQVAQLAGVPPQVIRAARKRLAQLEQQAIDAGAQGDLFATAAASATDAAPEHPALELLRESDPDALSPKQALELLYRLRQQLERR
jgi:DNA mismatch repair protein MutS